MLVQGCRKNIGPFEACREKTVLPHGPLPPTQATAGERGKFFGHVKNDTKFFLVVGMATPVDRQRALVASPPRSILST